MPLILAEVGEENIIKKIEEKQEVKVHLENLGFVVEGTITTINTISGNVIVKYSRNPTLRLMMLYNKS